MGAGGASVIRKATESMRMAMMHLDVVNLHRWCWSVCSSSSGSGRRRGGNDGGLVRAMVVASGLGGELPTSLFIFKIKMTDEDG